MHVTLLRRKINEWLRFPITDRDSGKVQPHINIIALPKQCHVVVARDSSKTTVKEHASPDSTIKRTIRNASVPCAPKLD